MWLTLCCLVYVTPADNFQCAPNDPKCASKVTRSGNSRSAHWVIRSSDLKNTIHFLQYVLEMRVIRHEENPQACPVTCNGAYNASWSKTMVGFGTEDTHYALEVTYNYGVKTYPTGTGLQNIAVATDDVYAALNRAEQLGYKHLVAGGTPHPQNPDYGLIQGPDGYKFRLTPRAEIPEIAGGEHRYERFLAVTLRVQCMRTSLRFYESLLGMHRLHRDREPAGTAVVGYNDEQPVLILQSATPEPTQGGGHAMEEPVDAEEFIIEAWEGRHAIAMPETELRAAYKAVKDMYPNLVLHPIRELPETLGTLVLAIILDPNGYEICLVSAETFDKAVLAAADWKGPDWEERARLLAASAKLPKFAA